MQQYVQVKRGDLLVITREPCLEPSKISKNDLLGPAMSEDEDYLLEEDKFIDKAEAKG